jgi:uncharacterized DUF497 family protein
MDIGYIWDETKYEKVKQEHNVCFYEVIAAFDDPNGFDEVDDTEHEERWIWLGMTQAGRLLFIVFTDEYPLQRIITAYDAEGKWNNEYYERQRN